jgi:hypothetical protein
MKSHILSFLILSVLCDISMLAQGLDCGAHGKLAAFKSGNFTGPPFYCICDEGYIGRKVLIYDTNCCSPFQNHTIQFVASFRVPCDIPYDWKSGETGLESRACDGDFVSSASCSLLSPVESATS